MNTMMNLRNIGIWVGVCAALTGCSTISRPIPARPIAAYPSAEKVPLTVELRMSDDYHQLKWEYIETTMGLRTTLLDLYGEHLAVNTEACAKAVFAHVITNRAASGARLVSGAQAVLVPRLVRLDIAPDAVVTATWRFTMSLEWSLNDKEGKNVWVNTIKGEVKGKRMNKGQTKDRYDQLFKQVFEESYKQMLSAPAIRGYAAGTPQ